MRIVAIIPARMDSTRLPGKHLKLINGRELLYYLVRRLSKVAIIDDIILATTRRSVDNPLVNWADSIGVSIFRGSHHDVLNRFVDAAKYAKADIIIRANGDSPLIAPEVLLMGIKELVKKKYDFLTGKTFYTGLPIGIGSEIICYEVLEKLKKIVVTENHKEHVTNYIFDNPETFNWSPITVSRKWIASHVSLVVDSKDDFFRMEKIIKDLTLNIDDDPANWNIENIILSYNQLFSISEEGD